MLSHKVIEGLNSEIGKQGNNNEFIISNIRSILRNIQDEE